ncbi:hypothetical protein ABPG74_001108 [Tetrahymena malaccensis]
MKSQYQILKFISLTLLFLCITNLKIAQASYRSHDDCIIILQSQCIKQVFAQVSNLNWEQTKIYQTNQLFVYKKLAKYQKQNNKNFEDLKNAIVREHLENQSAEFTKYWQCIEESIDTCNQFTE